MDFPLYGLSTRRCEASVGRPYPEVTVAVLPSSLTKVLPFTLGYSPSLPVLVLVRILFTNLRSFSWHSAHLRSPPKR